MGRRRLSHPRSYQQRQVVRVPAGDQTTAETMRNAVAGMLNGIRLPGPYVLTISLGGIVERVRHLDHQPQRPVPARERHEAGKAVEAMAGNA